MLFRVFFIFVFLRDGTVPLSWVNGFEYRGQFSVRNTKSPEHVSNPKHSFNLLEIAGNRSMSRAKMEVFVYPGTFSGEALHDFGYPGTKVLVQHSTRVLGYCMLSTRALAPFASTGHSHHLERDVSAIICYQRNGSYTLLPLIGMAGRLRAIARRCTVLFRARTGRGFGQGWAATLTGI